VAVPVPPGAIMLGWLGCQGARFPGMPAAEVMQETRPVTRSGLVRDLRGLGVRPGDVLMVHTRVSAIGWVVGGAQTVVTALLDVLGPAGTLMAYVGWNDSTGGMIRRPAEWQEAYRAECPPFDPEFSETDRQMAVSRNASARGRARRLAAVISGGWRRSALQQAG
jgi:Aminoglycoside 3-N-acetyltransferase